MTKYKGYCRRAEFCQVNNKKINTENFEIRNISVNMIPRILIHEQKQQRLDVWSDLSSPSDVFDTVITGYETWSFLYDAEVTSSKH